MIKWAVIGYLIQWSSHSWYDILFRHNYAAPTAPHVFIASSTHVKLKSSLCTWYSIIARRNRRAQWENAKAGQSAVFAEAVGTVPSPSTHACPGNANRNLNIEQELKCFPAPVRWVDTFPLSAKKRIFVFCMWHRVFMWSTIIKDEIVSNTKSPHVYVKISHDCANSSNTFFLPKSGVLFN